MKVNSRIIYLNKNQVEEFQNIDLKKQNEIAVLIKKGVTIALKQNPEKVIIKTS